MQSWAFFGKGLGQSAPPLAGVFHPVSLGALDSADRTPMLMFRLVGAQHLFDTGPVWLFWSLQILYFYVISCMIMLLWNKLARRHDSVRTRIQPL